MRVLKIIGIVLLVLVAAFVVGYCCYSCSVVNSNVALSSLLGESFYSKDKEDYLYVRDPLDSSVFRVDGIYYFPEVATYEDSFLIFIISDETYYFTATSETRLYSYSFNEYFYRVKLVSAGGE